ncbi:MAG: hypothetical protein KGK07_15230 [Chloroflexota bacterium]|nr:hypothetical protein [Chloroflexota bacterium]
MIRYVPQEDANGCRVACLAMVLGVSYVEARALLGAGWAESGISHFPTDEVIGRAGWAVRRVYHYDSTIGRMREPWPPAPFAPLHIVETIVPAGAHADERIGRVHARCSSERRRVPWTLHRRGPGVRALCGRGGVSRHGG